jgi:hypothetical protein
MANAEPPIVTFFVEAGGNGWVVRVGGLKLSTFASRPEAVRNAKDRSAKLADIGKRSSVVVRETPFRPEDGA